jgi:hypothetical protein
MPAPLPPDDLELTRLLRNSLTTLPEVPSWASERALAVWQPPAARDRTGLLTRLQALLSFDSWQAQPGLALRAGGANEVRQLLYTVGEHDIDLRIAAQPRTPGAPSVVAFQISGQVLGPAVQGSITWLAQTAGDLSEVSAESEEASADTAPQAEIDALGEFVLSALPQGLGVLRLRLGEAAVDLPALHLQPAAEPGAAGAAPRA